MAEPKLLPYRPDIDGLRALAILLVVGFHAFPDIIHNGFIGVDIFFVISGFLISSIIFRELQHNKFSFCKFYARRIKRIFPALILVLLSCFFIGWFVLFAHEYKLLGSHISAGAAFIANLKLYKESGYFDVSSELKPLLHLWSLGIEEQFYLIWPLILVITYRLRTRFLLVTLSIIIISFTLNIFLIDEHKIFTFYMPVTRFWELLLGSALACLNTLESKPARIIDNIKSILGICLIIIALMTIDKEKNFPGYQALLPTAGAFFIIYAGQHAFLNRIIFSNKIAVFIGLISYPFYLWHWPLLSFARIMESGDASQTICIIAVTLSLVFSCLTYSFIEKPVRNYKYATSVLLFSMLFIAGLGAYTSYNKGFPARLEYFSQQEQQTVRTPAIDYDCERFFKKNSNKRLFDYCRSSGSKYSETIAIIGDSHAHALFPGIAEMFSSAHKNTLLLSNSSCPTLIGAVTGENDYEKTLCEKKINQIIDFLIKNHFISTVLIVTRGSVYITGNGFGVAEKNLRNKPIIPLAENNNTGKSAAYIFSEGLQATIDKLAGSGKKVYYISENPELGVDPFSCLGRPLSLTRKQICSFKKSTVIARQKEYLAAISNIRNAVIINSLNAFCPDDYCKFMENGTLLYADNNHLSIEGSRFVANTILKSYFLSQ